jgi:glycosyltransferase involved in cell wall biosynthesis
MPARRSTRSAKAEAARPVLLTVSGEIPADLDAHVAAGRRPRADYMEMAKAFHADVVDYSRAVAMTGRLGSLLRRVGGPDVTLAWVCFRERKRRDVVFTDSERVGLLLACLLRLTLRRRTARHVMIAHRISAPSKVRLHRLGRLRAGIDRVIVYASSQRDFAIARLGYEPDQVVLTPFMVDTSFWRPDAVAPSGARSRPMLCAVGQELRDYTTLAEAVRALDVDVVIAAASPWSKRADDTENMEQPANVEVVRLDQYDLRQLYQDATFTVVPTVDTDFQAGITAILESMAMARSVICTKTVGQVDTIVDAETGVYVEPGAVGDKRAAIQQLLSDAAERDEMASRARRWAVAHADIEIYAQRLATVVAGVRRHERAAASHGLGGPRVSA